MFHILLWVLRISSFGTGTDPAHVMQMHRTTPARSREDFGR
ncbi:hypothetical protein [Celeribacter sp.]